MYVLIIVTECSGEYIEPDRFFELLNRDYVNKNKQMNVGRTEEQGTDHGQWFYGKEEPSNFLKSPGPSISIVFEKEGDQKSNGVGAERTIIFGNSRVFERLESIDPPNYFI